MCMCGLDVFVSVWACVLVCVWVYEWMCFVCLYMCVYLGVFGLSIHVLGCAVWYFSDHQFVERRCPPQVCVEVE